MAAKWHKIVKQAQNTINILAMTFGVISSSKSRNYVNIQNVIDNEIRDVKVVGPFGIVSRPPTGLFAQMILNGSDNNSCVGVHDPNAPEVSDGEIIVYNRPKDNDPTKRAYIKLDENGKITVYGSSIEYHVNDVQIEYADKNHSH